MALSRCPGQERRFWRSDDTSEEPCPHCGNTIEFWKDDPRRRCISCGQLVRNPSFDIGCAKWCKFAPQCIGIPEAQLKNETLCEDLIKEMQKVFGDDRNRIRHTFAVLDYAESLLKHQKADPLVVKAAAVLHDIGIIEAEKKRGSSAAEFQELEGPPIARRILEQAGVDAEQIDHICNIIGDHHSAKTVDSIEFRIIWDADNLVNIFEGLAGREADKDKLKKLIAGTFKTEAGRSQAEKLLTHATKKS